MIDFKQTNVRTNVSDCDSLLSSINGIAIIYIFLKHDSSISRLAG